MAAGEILNLLARVNLAAAAAIVLVVAVRKIVRPRFGARLAYWLWLAPMLAAAAVLAPARAVTVVAAPERAAVLPFFESGATLSPPAAAARLAPQMLDPQVLAVALWLAGVAAAALVMAHLQRRFAAEARRGAVGPAVVGVIAPRIVTPADFTQRFSGAEQTLVLAHERAHIARHDSRLNGLSAAIQCLFWFNPLIHLAAHLMRIDQEMACDETVVTRFPEARRAYAEVLVKAQLAIRPLPLGCYWPSGTEHPLLERIAMLKRNDLSRRRRLAGGAVLAVLCAATGLAAWASQPPQVRIAQSPAQAQAQTQAQAQAPPAAISTPQAVDASAAKSPTADVQASAPGADAAEIARLGQLAAAATAPPPAPEARMIAIAALDPPPAAPRSDQPAPPRPAPGARASLPGLTDSQRETSRDYQRCQREAVKAFDDGHSSEDAIATQVEKRCETQYQTYRQAWSEGAGPGAPDQRAWTLDNGRQERARAWVHASRQATVRISDIKTCVGLVADQFSSEPFEQIVDQGVQRCGALIPFPVTPIGLEATMTDQQIHDREDRQVRATRTMIAADLRQAVKAKASQPQ